ncbi:hypothetical protein PROFUN_00067 [Planoprotostelium fungivorum]|uniref:Uncharacterized protein n=1 Tax=Planoprotostelium fungivorum TaxID=1890364 RepID=A0A2P6P0I8_9EUKA|nr:hypothetical protein PROFUN_00067 [Planoprotostelium fungivorum]
MSWDHIVEHHRHQTKPNTTYQIDPTASKEKNCHDHPPWFRSGAPYTPQVLTGCVDILRTLSPTTNEIPLPFVYILIPRPYNSYPPAFSSRNSR